MASNSLLQYDSTLLYIYNDAEFAGSDHKLVSCTVQVSLQDTDPGHAYVPLRRRRWHIERLEDSIIQRQYNKTLAYMLEDVGFVPPEEWVARGLGTAQATANWLNSWVVATIQEAATMVLGESQYKLQGKSNRKFWNRELDVLKHQRQATYRAFRNAAPGAKQYAWQRYELKHQQFLILLKKRKLECFEDFVDQTESQDTQGHSVMRALRGIGRKQSVKRGLSDSARCAEEAATFFEKAFSGTEAARSEIHNPTVHTPPSPEFLAAFNKDNVLLAMKARRLKKAAGEDNLPNELLSPDCEKL